MDENPTVELLRGHGLRSTPQRRAILAAFDGGAPEHLSADEVHARASQALPDLGRGTVYATLAEFTELGLLAAFGAPEPVRYEVNTAPHDHFRCRLCLRLFDIDGLTRSLTAITDGGFTVERIETRAEGVCNECATYAEALATGVRAIHTSDLFADLRELRGVAAAQADSPLGPLMLAATPAGLVRLAFEEHADVAALRKLAASRRGSEASHGHLKTAMRELERYFAGEIGYVECPIDWEALAAHSPEVLRATREIPYATTCSYVDVAVKLTPGELARPLGANPVPVLAPCHRVTRGVEVPAVFVGGAPRREWLIENERARTIGD
jgi:methylated-DNA-[protein]-cysteine S-methyltransferase